MAVLLLLFSESSLRRDRSRLAAWGVHLGLGLVVLGVAVSGPYKVTREAVLDQGESLKLDEYTLTYDSFHRYSRPGLEAYQARLTVREGDKPIGTLKPERRMYRNFKQPFAEASVLPGLGDEIYATLLGFSQEKVIRLQAQIHPMVNWIWIGGVAMTCCGLLGLRPRGRPQRS
jgi:cytochrome c-type biogenesis protein CcmF